MNLFDFFSFSSLAHNERRQADAALCTKNERPKNGADAKPCLSDVYKNGTRAKRKQADVPLCGRSMVEMLGVLAIIGVLSVGAISGYSKAMMKYKLNKQTEQIGSILDYTILYADQLHNSSTGYATELLMKLGAVPLEMTRPNERRYIYDVFNNPILITFAGGKNASYKSVRISIGSHAHEICLNLYQMAKLRSVSLWQTVFTRATEDISEEHANRVFGDAYCTRVRTCLKDLTVDKMYELCNACDGTNKCTFHILWDYQESKN